MTDLHSSLECVIHVRLGARKGGHTRAHTHTEHFSMYNLTHFIIFTCLVRYKVHCVGKGSHEDHCFQWCVCVCVDLSGHWHDTIMVVFSWLLMNEIGFSWKWCIEFVFCDFAGLRVASPQSQLHPEWGFLPVCNFAPTFCIYVGFIWVLWFLHIIQKHSPCIQLKNKQRDKSHPWASPYISVFLKLTNQLGRLYTTSTAKKYFLLRNIYYLISYTAYTRQLAG